MYNLPSPPPPPGHFGDVYSADYCPDGFNPEDAIKVAVKTAKKSCTEQQRKDILREISVMTNIVHPNLVRLYGINQEETEGLPWLVLEYMPHGDLKHYLKVIITIMITIINNNLLTSFDPFPFY